MHVHSSQCLAIAEVGHEDGEATSADVRDRVATRTFDVTHLTPQLTITDRRADT